MKKFKKITISLLVLIAITVSFASCDKLVDFYQKKIKRIDGPGTSNHEVFECFWVETYDEMLVVLAKMKSAGTQTPKIPAFDCEDQGIDVKFCITVKKADIKELSEGQAYYDTKLSYVGVQCIIFFESVTIKEIEETSYTVFNCYEVIAAHLEEVDTIQGAEDLKLYASDSTVQSEEGKIHVYYNGKNQFYLKKGIKSEALTEDQIAILAKTVVIIE